MTKEELMQYLTEHHIDELRNTLAYMAEHSCEYTTITWKCEFGSVTLTVGKAKEILEPPLPSNLDEAAEEYMLQDNEDAINSHQEYLIKSSFKAGAEWRGAQIPKLPDNLDEAAEAHAKECLDLKFPTTDPKCVKSDVLYTFKAGAKWMAGQGVTFEDTVVNDEYMGYTLAETIWDKTTLVNKFQNGDEVIVQIRKK